jgi:hypothetical protein
MPETTELFLMRFMLLLFVRKLQNTIVTSKNGTASFIWPLLIITVIFLIILITPVKNMAGKLLAFVLVLCENTREY